MGRRQSIDMKMVWLGLDWIGSDELLVLVSGLNYGRLLRDDGGGSSRWDGMGWIMGGRMHGMGMPWDAMVWSDSVNGGHSGGRGAAQRMLYIVAGAREKPASSANAWEDER